MPVRQPRLRALSRVVAVVLVGALTTGCTTTTLIPAPEIILLSYNGSPPGAPHVAYDVNGELVTLRDSFTVEVETFPGLPPEWAHWSESAPPIKSPFTALILGPMLVLQSNGEAQATKVPFAYVQGVRVQVFSPGKTAGLVVGATLGGIAAIVGTSLLVAVSSIR